MLYGRAPACRRSCPTHRPSRSLLPCRPLDRRQRSQSQSPVCPSLVHAALSQPPQGPGESAPSCRVLASARRARYAALDKCAKENNAVAVLLGHTKDDQAETVLLGLARGSGARSLSGMAVENGIYLRPFLNVTREQTVSACKELNLEPWNDPHNEDSSFLRVRVRKEVLPIMERQLGPGVKDALVRSAQLLRDDADALDALAAEFWAADKSLEIEPLSKLAKAVRTRVIRLALFESGVSQLSAEQVGQVEALISNWKGQGEVSLPAGVKVSRISGRLTLS